MEAIPTIVVAVLTPTGIVTVEDLILTISPRLYSPVDKTTSETLILENETS